MLDLNNHNIKELEFIEEENDLGHIIDNKLRFSTYYHIPSEESHQNNGTNEKTIIDHLEKISFRYLFNSLVKPHLECYV